MLLGQPQTKCKLIALNTTVFDGIIFGYDKIEQRNFCEF